MLRARQFLNSGVCYPSSDTPLGAAAKATANDEGEGSANIGRATSARAKRLWRLAAAHRTLFHPFL
jgi:hypothetical protein